MNSPVDPAASAASSGSEDELAALRRQVTDLTAQVQKLTDMAARAQADLQNAKGRMQRDREELGRFATENVVRLLLPVLDHFRRAVEHLPKDRKDDEWTKGVLAIEQEFFRVLSELGLARMEVLGAQVDTARHEVLSVGPGAEGEVTEVFEDGYEIAGKVIRPAKVKVGDGSVQKDQGPKAKDR